MHESNRKRNIKKENFCYCRNLNALKLIKNMTREQYADDIYKRKATERLLQELIEAAIDVNTHIIVQTSNIVPDDYYESFIKLGELKIMTTALAEKLAPSAGLRNRLVHEYDLIEHAMILEAVKVAVDIYPQYIKAIEDYVLRQD